MADAAASRFPRRLLVLPPLLTLGLYLFAAVTAKAGIDWNIHGWGALLLIAIAGSAFATAFIELALVARCVVLLRRQPALRSTANYAALSVAVAFLALLIVLIWRDFAAGTAGA